MLTAKNTPHFTPMQHPITSQKMTLTQCVKSVRIRSFLVRIFPHSDSVRMWENTDQNNSEDRHLLRSGRCSGHCFVSKFLKEMQIIVISIFCFWNSQPQNVFIFFVNFSRISFRYKKQNCTQKPRSNCYLAILYIPNIMYLFVIFKEEYTCSLFYKKPSECPVLKVV